MTSKNRPIVKFSDVDIVFGENPDSALPMIDEGRSREDIQEETRQVLGVANCSLDVQQGEIVVLMGLSGSGKSTLLRTVNGLNRATRGDVEVATDESLENYVNPSVCDPRTLRKLRQERVAMVFQQFGLLPWRTVSENVGFGLELSGVSKKDIAKRVNEQLELVALSSWGDHKVDQLSGGMQQRVGLARAFATSAPVLLMDEPFSALDPLIRDKLQDDLLELQSVLKRTIIFVSHDLDEAFKLGNRVAIMEGGRIVQCGTAREIIQNPTTDYVAEFVAHVNPLNVLCAADVMQETLASTVPDRARKLPIDTPIRHIMTGFLDDMSEFYVVDNGIIKGVVRPDGVMRSLAKS